jgi:CubicO group peptidase (beta-lactamase class C family)
MIPSPPMRPLLTLAAAATLAIAFATAPASTLAPQADQKFEQIAALVTQKMAEYGVPGVAVGILKNGQATVRGLGVTNLDNSQPVTPDTVFPLASISKTVTTTAMMRLVEQGKVDLNATVAQYLPGFKVQDEAATRNVKVWHLLTHTPGWEGQLTAEDRGPLTLATFIDALKDLPKLAEPGEVWSYNNAGFNVAGRVIEVVSGQPIHNAFRALVFEPIGLTRAFTRVEDLVTYPFAVAHRGAPGQVTVARPLSRSVSVAAGGVSMSLNDILKYAKFHLGDGTGHDGKPVLTRATLEQMRTPRLRKNSTDDEMGLGWHLRRVGGVMTAAHGGTLGHILLLELVPERNLALAILTNHANGWRLIQDVERAALTLLEGMTLDPAQAIGHRGLNETMPDAPILAKQPDPAPYLGMYRRPPMGTNTVRVQDGQLKVDDSAIAFYAPDRALVTSGNQKGNPVEFIRNGKGEIGWVRLVGRIARKD